MSGLLKYRYQKPEKERLASITSPPGTSVESTTGTKCATKQPCPVSPTPIYSQKTYTSTSPFQKPTLSVTANRTVHSAGISNGHIDSSQSQESPVFSGVKRMIVVTPHKASEQLNSSPWKPKPTMKRQFNSSPSSQGSSVHTPTKQSNSLSSPDREALVHISGLVGMFPNKKRVEIEHALKGAHNNFDQAVDFLIDNKYAHIACRDEKRKCDAMSSAASSPFSSPIRKPIKRARKLSSDDDDDVDLTIDDAPEVPASPTESQVLADKVKFLQNAFPLLPRQMLVATLKEQGDIDATCAVLENMCSKQVSQTENVGSIKAMKQSRIIAKATGTTSTPVVQHQSPTKQAAPSKEVIDLGSDNEWEGEKDEEGEEAVSSDEEQDMYQGQQGVILKFLNECCLADLVSVDGCSLKKAQAIVEIRPFQNWDHMATSFEQSKYLSFKLLTSCKELLRIREVVKNLIHKCERISKEIEAVVSEFTGNLSLEQTSNVDYISEQPSILNPQMKLTPYQLVGLNWLCVMHHQDLNGILGDEMGLGKTIQTIAFLAQLKIQGEDGPHLVIAPSSTLDNWLRELKIWCPSLKVLMYYGSQEDRSYIRQQLMNGTHDDFDVAVTTYNMATGSIQDRALFKKFGWHYAVFDEGHMLKNMSSMRYRALARIMAKRRLLLTGTPLQNNLLELMSLLNFVMPDMFTNKTDHLKKIFNSMTGKSADENRSAFEIENITHAKNILKPFFLRRLKTEVLPQLPKKTEFIKDIQLACEQRELYDKVKAKFTKVMKEEGTAGLNGSAVMMQLRKAANHHMLHRVHYDVKKLREMAKKILKEPDYYDSVEQYVFEDMEVMSDFELHRLCKQHWTIKDYRLDDDLVMESGKFRYLDSVLPGMKEQGSRVLLFSQFTMMMDVMEVYMKKRGYKFIRLDGQTPVAERQGLIDRYNTDPSIFVFLLSTRAGGLGINLTAANIVIMHDMDFNPYNDKQAEDRCHRLGQKRDVTIIKLVSTNTIEEGILKCAREKLKLEQDVTGSTKGDRAKNKDVMSLLQSALEVDS